MAVGFVGLARHARDFRYQTVIIPEGAGGLGQALLLFTQTSSPRITCSRVCVGSIPAEE
jgi:hypothetical protein